MSSPCVYIVYTLYLAPLFAESSVLVKSSIGLSKHVSHLYTAKRREDVMAELRGVQYHSFHELLPVYSHHGGLKKPSYTSTLFLCSYVHGLAKTTVRASYPRLICRSQAYDCMDTPGVLSRLKNTVLFTKREI